MRRALALLLFAGACSAPAPTPRPPVETAKPVVAAPHALELGGTREATLVTRRSAGGEALYTVKLRKVTQALPATDGGAYVIVEEQRGYRMRGVLVHLDAQGHEAWRAGTGDPGWSSRARLLTASGWVFVIDGKHLHLVDPTGKATQSLVLPEEVSDADQRSGVLAIADERAVRRLNALGGVMWSVDLHRFPSLDPSADARAQRRVAVGEDGTVLTGASDGSLVALDPDGRALFQLGVRGAVARIEARPDGDFVVSTEAGIATTISARGVVRGERVTSVALAEPPGPGVIDLRKDGPGAQRSAVPWRATLARRAHREGALGTPFHDVLSVVAVATDDVWALVRGEVSPGKEPPAPRLFHRDASGFHDLGAPSVTFAKEVYAAGEPAAAGVFTASSLARGPGDTLLVIGKRGPYPNRPCVLERSSAGLRERRDLFPLLATFPSAGWAAEPTYARSAAGHEVLCDGEATSCIELGPDLPPRRLPKGEGKSMPRGVGEARRSVSETPLLFAGETLWKARGWALGEAEVWSLGETAIERWNGSGFDRRETPLTALHDVWGSARDDLWVTGREGVAHFDGERWWRILEIDDDPGGPAEGPLSVTGSKRGDAWIFGRSGLFHVTIDPAAQPDLEGATPPPPPAATPSSALVIRGEEPGYHLERVTLDVDGGPPLRAALDIAEGPGGLLWIHDGARLVEHDGTRGRVLQQAPRPAPFVCWSAPENDCEVCVACARRKPEPVGCLRCAAPLAPGEGALLADEGLRWIKGGRPAAVPGALSALTAAAASPSGAIWAVSARRDDAQPHAVVLDPRGLRLVVGLPPAGYADVAARADDDVWIAGGLSSEADATHTWPAGEGTLVHFDGRAFRRERGPEGALLAVAAVGPAEAWAVGVGGGVLHARGALAEPFHLENDRGEKLGVTLRAVAARGASELWIGGDASTLLRWDGQALRRVDTREAGSRAAFTTVLPPGSRPGLVAGPSGIWKVVR